MQNSSTKINKRYNYLLGEINSIYHDMALKLGLSNSAMNILYTICDNDGECLLRDICRYSGLSKQTINSALRKLEEDDIVKLINTTHKYKTVTLTDKGKELAHSTVMVILQMENSIYNSWSPEDVDMYLKLTERYMNDIKARYHDL